MHSLTELLKDHQMFHSKFQQDNLITKRAGGTLYGQYKQSLRELYKRVRGLRSDWYALEKSKNKIDKLEVKEKTLQLEIKQLEREINNWDTLRDRKDKLLLEVRELEVKLSRVKLDISYNIMMLEEQDRSKMETFRELKRFYAQANWLKMQLQKQYGELTDEVKEKLDIDMWMYKIKEMIAIDMVYNGRLLNTTYEFLVALPQDLKKDIMGQLRENGQGPASFIEWYEKETEKIIKPQIPIDLPMPTEKDILKLFSDNNQYLIEDIQK